MRVYFRYAVKETLSNLWRNRMMTIAAVLTVAVSLVAGRVGAAAEAECRAGVLPVAAGHPRHRLDAAHGVGGRDRQRADAAEQPADREAVPVPHAGRRTTSR